MSVLINRCLKVEKSSQTEKQLGLLMVCVLIHHSIFCLKMNWFFYYSLSNLVIGIECFIFTHGRHWNFLLSFHPDVLLSFIVDWTSHQIDTRSTNERHQHTSCMSFVKIFIFKFKRLMLDLIYFLLNNTFTSISNKLKGELSWKLRARAIHPVIHRSVCPPQSHHKTLLQLAKRSKLSRISSWTQI